MNESTISVGLTEEEILIYEASDEALEAAASHDSNSVRIYPRMRG